MTKTLRPKIECAHDCYALMMRWYNLMCLPNF